MNEYEMPEPVVEVVKPRCGTIGCQNPRMEERPWCSIHNLCDRCGETAVEGRHMGEPRCEKHGNR